MKTIIISMVLLAMTGCATWTTTQKTLGFTSVALDAQDYKQTKAIIAQGGHEDNFLVKNVIGEHPSAAKLLAYKTSGAALKLYIADSFPVYRTEILVFANLFQLSINARNAKTIGWEFKF